jgi:hypothetical protein
MIKSLLFFLIIFIAFNAFGDQVKISDLPETTTTNASDVVPIVTNMGATPETDRCQLQYLWMGILPIITSKPLYLLRVNAGTNGIEWLDPATFATINQTMYIGTTSTTINRTTANELLTGITNVYAPAEYNNGTCTTAKTIDPVNGKNQKVTLTNAQTCVLTFTQPASGTADVKLKIIQSAVSSYNGVISGCKWPGGVVPTITATTGAVDFIAIYFDGSTAYCFPAQDFR